MNFPRNIRMDQWRSKFSESFSLDRYWSIECSSLFLRLCGGFGSGSEKGVFWKRGLFRNIHLLETLENLEILESLENPQTVEKKGESDHFLEIRENFFEILEILETPPAQDPFRNDPFFRSRLGSEGLGTLVYGGSNRN